jgi:hypothetical protein
MLLDLKDQLDFCNKEKHFMIEELSCPRLNYNWYNKMTNTMHLYYEASIFSFEHTFLFLFLFFILWHSIYLCV